MTVSVLPRLLAASFLALGLVCADVQAADAAPGDVSFSFLQAEDAEAQQGTTTEATQDVDGGSDLTSVSNGDWIRYDQIQFLWQAPAMFFQVRIASGAARNVTGTIEVRIDSDTGPAIASVPVASTGGWQSWTTPTVALTRTVAYRHDVYVRFVSAQKSDFVNVNWIRFL
ncbi:MAG: 1,3-beta-glucanase [Actinomycetia bacterium]|jgi:hypothetical protein|nr:1,3-beta-glucanase [Actinomycetes bacterium]